eukprot:scaffold3410_cov141-Cylindrotheca_fusiformis.AAC.20
MATTISMREDPPKSMVDALDCDDPYEALLALSEKSHETAQQLSTQLVQDLEQFKTIELPELLHRLPNLKDVDSHPVSTAVACSESILNSLTKIASGGSQASQEIKQLEDEKRTLEEHAQDVETALILRKASDQAAQSLSAQRYEQASRAIATYLQQKQQKNRLTERATQYAGEYTVTQLESTHQSLCQTLMEQYSEAVQQSDVVQLGKLTPLVQMVQMEQEAVALYVRFLTGVLSTELGKVQQQQEQQQQQQKQKGKGGSNKTPPHVGMARVYNTAVTILRHHLPMVSHCLHRADGDAAVVQLVHLQVEQAVSPLFQQYIQSKQLAVSSANAQRIYQALEVKYKSSGFSLQGDDFDHKDDCGFAQQVGSLADVDAALEEAALCLQHAESYTRFIEHTVREVNKARAMRFRQAQEQKRIERERKEWATGLSSSSSEKKKTENKADSTLPFEDDDEKEDDDAFDEDEDEDYKPLEILPPHTKLHEEVAEVGGYYSVIERSLLLASMQRAFGNMIEEDLRFYNPLGLSNDHDGNSSNSTTMANTKHALQTSLVESCLYAARRGTQRAFATGHTGTASAVANFCSDCLEGILAEHLSRRAEDIGVSALKPGEGLISGSGGIFNATTNLIRQGQTVSHAVGGAKAVDEAAKRRKIQEGIAFACATLNDLEVAAHHTHELEKVLLQAVDRGFPPNTPHTEQLRMCVQGLSSVAETFEMSANSAVESLVSVMKPRIRAIVTDAVGDGSGGASFAVMGGANAADRHAVRMNYNLDEEAYELLAVSEGYISRLCTCLDELIQPLCNHLADRLADAMVLEVIGTACKRLEVSLKKCHYTAMGALSLDSDVRDFINYSKDRLASNELNSNVALYRACTPLSRLLQIAKLMNVDDLEDVVDLVNASKRKQMWDLSSQDVKAFLCLREEFEEDRINQLLRLDD